MRKTIVAFLATCILFSSMLSAQVLAGNGTDFSKTAIATNSLFTGDRENYVSPLYFNLVDKNMFFLGFGTPRTEASKEFRAGIGLPLGFMYTGAFVALNDSLTGNLGGNQATIINKTQDWTYDAFGNMISNEKTTTKNVDYTNNKSNLIKLLAGLKIGEMNLGIYNSFLQSDFSRYGNYDGTVFGTIGTPGTTATSTAILDAAGVVIRNESEEYALGNSMLGKGITDNLVVGLTVPLSGMKLFAQAGASFATSDSGSTGAMETYLVRPLLGFASFTPTTFLPGKTAAAIADTASYNFYDQKLVMKAVTVTPMINATVEMDIPLIVPATFNGGLGFEIALVSHTGSYSDTALAAQVIKGYATTYRSVAYSTASTVPNEIKTTLVDTRQFGAVTYTADTSMDLSLPLAMTFKPVGDFQFAIGLEPVFTFGSQAYASSGSRLITTTYFDGDAMTTLDPDDYVSIRTVTDAKETTVESSFDWNNTFTAAAQFYMVPQKFRFNLGAITTWMPISRRTVTTTVDSVTTDLTTRQNGDQTTALTTQYIQSDPGTQTETFFSSGSLDVQYRLGATYFFSQNMYIDMYFSNTSNVLIPGSWYIDLTIKL